MPRQKLTQAFVDKAPIPAAERAIYWDASMPGFGLMVTSAGHKSFVYQYRAGRRSRRITIQVDGLDSARKQAKKHQGRVADGKDPLAEKRKADELAENTLKSVCEEYLKRDAKKLRTLEWRRDVLERLVYPTLGARPIADIRRSEIVRLLDRIEAGELTKDGKRIKGGPVMADRVLAVVRKVMNWHATRSDDFRSPIVRGMARTKPKERARERTLADDELRAVWRAAERDAGPFGPFVQFLLLTGARRSEAAAIGRSELAGADWTLPGGRNKTKVDLVRPLSDAAVAALGRLKKIGDGDLVFTSDGENPLGGFSQFKRKLDKAILEELRKLDPEAKPLPRWTLHDLRRTARSLMSRAGVPSDHAERCLGHVMPGVRGTYDRHEYHDEKRLAFEALAAQIERILNPQDNVVPLRGAS